jgi:hypothetical protein
LPPAKGTKLEGEISLDFDNDDLSVLKPAAEKVTPETKPDPDSTPEAEKDDFDLTPDPVKEALKKLKDDPAEKPEKVEAEKIEVPDTKATAKDHAGRKYTGVEEVDAVLKKLPNGTYDKVKDEIPKWYDAFKKQSEAPKYLAAHPDGYKLSPQYQAAASDYQQKQFEAQSVRASLLQFKNNQPIKLLYEYNDKGEPVYQTINPVNGKHDAAIELTIQEYFNNANGNLQAASQALQGSKQAYDTWVAKDHAFIEDTFKKLFKDIDPTTMSPEEKKFEKLMEPLIPDSITPAHARRLAHYAMVSNLRLAKSFAKYVEQTKAPTIRPKAGPNGAGVGDSIPLNNMFNDD